MNTLKCIALAAGLGCIGFLPASAATVFVDSAAFAAATTDIETETFDANITGPTVFNPNTAITFANGFTSTATTNQQFNEVRNGAFRGGTRAGINDTFDRTITFNFGSNITAFGGTFTNPAPIIVSGLFDGVQSSFLLGDFRTDTGFFGLTSTTGFSTLTFSTNTGGFLPFGNPTVSVQAINFTLDDLSTGQANVAPVPLPASALLLLGAFGGLGAIRKLRRRA